MKTLVTINQLLIGGSMIIQCAFIGALMMGSPITSSTASLVLAAIVGFSLILTFFTQVHHLQYLIKIPRIEELEKHDKENWKKYEKATQRLNKAASLIEEYNNKIETARTEM